MAVSSKKTIFLDALDIASPSQREAFVATACGDDQHLRAEVQELLVAHQRDDNPLDEPPMEFDGTVAQPALAGKLPDDTKAYTPSRELLDQEIGPYRLMEQIGEGGFGLVFVAQQQRPVRRQVALKLIKPGMDSKEVIARFEAERQALALMDHPNIAQVYDAGTSAEGRPYFVMELVRGVPIAEFCDRHRLNTAARLELFVSVCQAIQHAHQKGIIHRDLKPSNILVTLHDAKPVAKVIDFGVAKAIGQSMTDKTIYTRFTAMIGTPLYMSPEQAEMTGQDVDTRSDIYSLGVILYELLTGSTPFDSDRLQQAGLDEMRRIIREEEPPRPSTRLTTLGQALTTISATRSIEQSRLPGLIRGDLDWIVMKAMDKVRSRRYESASALATDVQRYLREEPVEARPPSTIYRFQKFARRNRVLLTTASLVAAAMLVGTSVSVWQAIRATTERNEKAAALDEAMIARKEADAAKLQVEEFNNRLKEATVLAASGQAHADSDSWYEAHADYTRATELLPDYFLVWIERGSFYVQLGLWDLAAHDYSQALELGASPSGANWWGIPQLFVLLGQSNRYAELCKHMLEENHPSDELPFDSLRAVVLAPVASVDYNALANRADSLVDSLRGDSTPSVGSVLPFGDFFAPPREQNRPPRGVPGERGIGPPPPRDGQAEGRSPGSKPPRRGFRRGYRPLGIVLHVAGLTYYRAEQYDKAIETLLQGNNSDRGWPGRGLSHPVLAMAYHQTGNDQQATEALAAAEMQYTQWAEQMANGEVGEMPLPWFDWIEFVTLYREANQLIIGQQPPEAEPLQLFKQQALQAIQANSPPALP